MKGLLQTQYNFICTSFNKKTCLGTTTSNGGAPTLKDMINFYELMSDITKLGKRVDSFNKRLVACSNTLMGIQP